MKPLLFLLSFTLLGNICHAQTINTKPIDTLVEYYDGFWNKISPEKKEYAQYYRTITHPDEKKWIVKDFYAYSNKVQMSGSYSDKYLSTKQGTFNWYYENGVISETAYHVDNKIVGLHKGFDTTGRLNDTTYFNKEGIPEGVSTKWDASGGILSQRVFSENGTGEGYVTNYYDDGTLNSEGKVSAFLEKDSIWTYYYDNGKIASYEEYDKGKWLSYRCYTTKGKLQTKNCDTMIMPSANYNVYKFLSNHTNFPSVLIGELPPGSYSVHVKFIVAENGKIIKPKILKKNHELLNKEALRIVSRLPKWEPGLSRNRPVKTYYVLPIKFTIPSQD